MVPSTAQRRADRRRRASAPRWILGVWHGLRMRCSALREHLHHHGLVASPVCQCGTAPETVVHFVLECRRHASARAVLFRELAGLPMRFSIEALLLADGFGIDEGNARVYFGALLRFIAATRRF